MKGKEYFQIYCQFSGLAKKTIRASSLEDALQIAESTSEVECGEIVRFTEPCKVDTALSHKISESMLQKHHDFNYKSWGSE